MTDTTIVAVGDVFLERDNPESAFQQVTSLFAGADVTFANIEGVYAPEDRWHRAPSAGVPLVADPKYIPHIATAGITAVSLANNHSVDGGFEALVETRDALRSHAIATAGAGTNIDDARRPAIIDHDGKKIAILAYASVFPRGYEARPSWPGLAPLRATTYYELWEPNEHNPGLLPRVRTAPHAGDHEALRSDIAEARRHADIVLVSVHWGDFTRPYVLTDHERRAARIAIDAGADAVLGHHQHLLRGIEFYQGKPIFYGLGHFVFDLPNFEDRLARDAYLGRGDAGTVRSSRRRFGEHRIGPREGYPLLPFHEDARLTGVALITVAGDTDTQVSAQFVPCHLGPDNVPTPAQTREQAQQVADYLIECCRVEELPTDITVAPGASGIPWTLHITEQKEKK